MCLHCFEYSDKVLDRLKNVKTSENGEIIMERKFIADSEQTWDNFAVQMGNRKLVIFGAGIAGSVLFMRYPDIPIALIIDNSIKKQGHFLKDFLFGAVNQETVVQTVKPFDEIKSLNADECVVLVTAWASDSEMMQQLQKRGFYCCFNLKLMETDSPTIAGEAIQEYPRYLKKLYYAKCREMEINSRKLVVTDMGHYSGHGKSITEQLLKICRDIEIVWVLDDTEADTPKGVRKVWAEGLQYHEEMASAGYWLIGNSILLTDIKRPEQTYIHMKHWASVTLKTFGFDFYEFRGIEGGLTVTKHDCESIDYLIVGSKFDEDTCRKGYRYDGPVFYAGSPRSDILFKPDRYKVKIHENFKIESKKKILLYAPTFRGGTGKEYIYDSYSVIPDFRKIKKILEQDGSEWVVLLRLHPIVAQESPVISRDDFVIDANAYEDSEELVAACDMLISDYSSIMFEPAFVHKPVFLYAPDRAEYINHERRLLIDYDSLPFDIAENDEELCCIMKEFNQQEYDSRLDAFFEKHGVHEDGHAGERAAEFISRLMSEE